MPRHDDAWRKKVSEALKGRRPKNLSDLHAARKGGNAPWMAAQNNHNWKGEDAGYGAIHAWVYRNFGTPSKCEKCGTTSAIRYEWDNIDGTYKRERSGWQRLCVSCHRLKTFSNPDFVHWNNGVQTNTGRTHIKQGQHISPNTEFKKGLTPWNKYLTKRACETCAIEFTPKEDSRKYCCRRCYWDSLRRS